MNCKQITNKLTSFALTIVDICVDILNCRQNTNIKYCWQHLFIEMMKNYMPFGCLQLKQESFFYSFLLQK